MAGGAKLPPLPPVAREIADLVGHAQALELLKRLGGMRVRFGGALAAEIAAIVGADEHAKLVARFGSEPVDLPRCHDLLRRAGAAAIIAAAREQQLSANDTAIIAGVTRRTVFEWRREFAAESPPPTSPNADLFEG